MGWWQDCPQRQREETGLKELFWILTGVEIRHLSKLSEFYSKKSEHS